MATPKHNWDTRAWLLGIVGGAVGGSLASAGSAIRLFKSASTTCRGIRGSDTTAPMLSAAHPASSLCWCCPACSAGWRGAGLFCGALCRFAYFSSPLSWKDCFENGITHLTSFWWELLVILAACFLASSGPVSLIRWQRGRAARRQEAQAAAYQAMREAASVPQEGVWPPPPQAP